jgi:hemerythrin
MVLGFTDFLSIIAYNPGLVFTLRVPAGIYNPHNIISNDTMEVKWDSSMAVGEETIDNQHKRLLSQINKLVQTVSSLDVNIGQLRETIHFLYEYINEHFSYEETYMLRNKYPDFNKHKAMHEGFIKFYDGFQKKLMERSTKPNFSSVDIKELLEEANKYLSGWLINHIKRADMQYADYIKKQKHSK